MTHDDAHLRQLLRRAVAPVVDVPARDLWPSVMARNERRAAWSWLDLGLAAGVLAAFMARPDWLVLLLYCL